MTERLFLAGAEIEMLPSGMTTSTYGDGSFVKAWPGDSAEDRARAVSLGYATDDASLTWDHLVAMSRHHEAGHHMLAHFFGLPASPTLYGVAQRRYWPHWQREESAVLSIQAFALAAGVDLLTVTRRIAG